MRTPDLNKATQWVADAMSEALGDCVTHLSKGRQTWVHRAISTKPEQLEEAVLEIVKDAVAGRIRHFTIPHPPLGHLISQECTKSRKGVTIYGCITPNGKYQFFYIGRAAMTVETLNGSSNQS